MFRTILLLLIAAAVTPLGAQAQAPRSPEAVARALQTRYQSIRDFTADFVQTYRGGVLKTQTKERGTVAVKKPGKMRWVYTNPDRKELVSDGLKTYWYIPDDKQVVVSDVSPADQASTPALFLSGKGDIVRDFTASFVEGAAPGTVALKLVPRRAEPEYEHLVLILDAASLQIRGLTTRDRQGGESTLTFTNMKENRGLSDNDFVFRVPRGVNVTTDATR
jgi:outer membrane lipoprotein carrier protein